MTVTSPRRAWKIRFRDLRITDPVHKSELLAAVDRVLSHGQLLMGEEVESFEREFAGYCGAPYCVGVASGTDALYLALRAYDIGPGDEVITTPLSWIATLNAIQICGARGVFVDIADDLNMRADLVEAAITPATKAVMPVHYTGRLCRMDAIGAAAQRHGIRVIEDAAQAFGAKRGGKLAGAFGHAGAFSLNPMKVLPACGEAGAVLTGDAKIRDKLVALRYLGTVNREVCHWPSLNAKIDTLQAAMLLVNLKYAEANVRRRIQIGRFYSNELAPFVRCPEVVDSPTDRDVFFDYTIRAERRDELKAFLEEAGIEIKIKHPILMPDQPAYQRLPRQELPLARRVVGEILSLPIHEKLTDAEVECVAASVKRFYRGRKRAVASLGHRRNAK